MADSDLTLAATLATELGVSSADARLPRLIQVASDAVRGYLRRARLHYGAAIVEKVRGFGTKRLVLDVCPIVSIASIVMPDGSTVDASEYVIEEAEAGLMQRDAGWLNTGVTKPGLLYDLVDAGTQKPSIVVTYAGGWVTPAQVVSPLVRSLPFDIEEATIQTAVGLYRRGGADGTIGSESLGDYSVSYRLPNSIIGVGGIIPDSVLAQLAAYRRSYP